jgi:transcriptional regulator with XRE-family HTH domain
MQKSIVSREHKILLACLKEAREASGLTQTDLADRLGMTQSQISKCERGERRLDLIELRAWCQAIGTKLTTFVRNFDNQVS